MTRYPQLLAIAALLVLPGWSQQAGSPASIIAQSAPVGFQQVVEVHDHGLALDYSASCLALYGLIVGRQDATVGVRIAARAYCRREPAV